MWVLFSAFKSGRLYQSNPTSYIHRNKNHISLGPGFISSKNNIKINTVWWIEWTCDYNWIVRVGMLTNYKWIVIWSGETVTKILLVWFLTKSFISSMNCGFNLKGNYNRFRFIRLIFRFALRIFHLNNGNGICACH